MKDEQTLQIINEFFSMGKFDNDFYNLIHGHYFIEREGKLYNTGIIKSNHISKILKKYSSINWNDVIAQIEYVQDFRVRYILRIIKFIISNSRFAKDTPFDNKNNINLAYITSNNYVLSPEVYLNTKVKFSYTIPFIYTSAFNNHFSECSIDIFQDRLSQKIRYDKGIIVNVENKSNGEFFYIDRKANISNIYWYINNTIQKNDEYTKLFIDAQELAKLKSLVSEFLDESRGGIDNTLLVEKIIHISNILKFSFFGFLLFEIIHEYFIEKGCDIFKANQLIRTISPNQFVLWSMRSFTISSLKEMLLKLSTVILYFNSEEFINFVADEFAYRIYLFVGRNEEFLEECIAVSLFSAKIHAIELSEVDLDESKNFINSESYEKLKHINGVDAIFEAADNGSYKIKDPSVNITKLIEISDEFLRPALQHVYKNYLIKVCYSEIRQKMKEDIVDYIHKNNIGSVMANLQPDDRGEYMLLPNYLSGVKYMCKSFTLDAAMNMNNISKEKPLYLS